MAIHRRRRTIGSPALAAPLDRTALYMFWEALYRGAALRVFPRWAR